MLDESLLNDFISGNVNINDIGQNTIAKRLVEYAIMDAMGKKIPDDCPYDHFNIAHNNNVDDGLHYVVLGGLKNDSGGHLLRFSEDCTQVAFDANSKLNKFKPSLELVKYLQACVQRIKAQADVAETVFVDDFTSTIHYGTEEQIEQEFDEFITKKCDSLSRGVRQHIRNAFPFKFNYKGRILQYLIEHDGNMDNIHPIHKD